MAKATAKKAEQADRAQAARVVRALARDYADAQCALHFQTPFQLLLATILSAQCTDERVNLVTDSLFQRYPAAVDVARLPLRRLEKLIQSTGFFRNKARNIKSCAEILVERYDGQVPASLDDLVELPGVGRKTANVVLGTAFGIASGVVVDTHVGRISRRLGLTRAQDAVKVENDLMKLLPKRQWIAYSHRMIHHGRQVCTARKPRCNACSMRRFCPRVGVPS